MSKNDSDASKSGKKKSMRWAITVFVMTILISAVISLLSEVVIGGGMVMAFVILLFIVALGIVFDTVGVAVTSADEKPFHSMASRKVPGAKESILLLRNAGQVSSICNDVIGDICGVVSGAASATIAVRVLDHFDFSWPKLVTLFMSSLVAGLTVGGKALGKSFAISSCTQIVYRVGKLIYFKNHIFDWLRRK